MANLLYPGSGSATSIETIFIDGYRFDICEVMSHCYEYLAPKGKYSRPMGRFFVEVEERHVIRYHHTEKLHAAGMENRWDFFCMDKSSAKAKVAEFETMPNDYNRLVDALEKKPMFTFSLQPKIDSLKTRIFEVYGIKLPAQN